MLQLRISQSHIQNSSKDSINRPACALRPMYLTVYLLFCALSLHVLPGNLYDIHIISDTFCLLDILPTFRSFSVSFVLFFLERCISSEKIHRRQAFFRRGLARQAFGDLVGAEEDLKAAVRRRLRSFGVERHWNICQSEYCNVSRNFLDYMRIFFGMMWGSITCGIVEDISSKGHGRFEVHQLWILRFRSFASTF